MHRRTLQRILGKHREIDRLPVMDWISMFFNYQLMEPVAGLTSKQYNLVSSQH